MLNQNEHAHDPESVRVIEAVGVSTRSWEDVVRQAVDRVATSDGHVTGVELMRSTAVVRDGKIAEYHADVKVACIIEPAIIEA
jgi:flavin-binding protein dodecin